MVTFLRIFVSGMFAASAIAKCIDYSGTVNYVATMFALGDAVARWGVAMLVCVELGFAVCVLLRNTPPLVFRLGFAMLIVFSVLNASFMFAGVSNCGCMGTMITIDPLHSLIKNLCTIAALFIIRRDAAASSREINFPCALDKEL